MGIYEGVAAELAKRLATAKKQAAWTGNYGRVRELDKQLREAITKASKAAVEAELKHRAQVLADYPEGASISQDDHEWATMTGAHAQDKFRIGAEVRRLARN